MARRVTRTIRINRPVELVAAQFGDVAHHERTGVHHKTRFKVTAEDDATVRYRQHSRVGPFTIAQDMVLDRADPRHQVNDITSGPLAGGSITFALEAADDDVTEVVATLALPNRRTTAVLAPLLLRVGGRDLAHALREDRADLEGDRYPAARSR